MLAKQLPTHETNETGGRGIEHAIAYVITFQIVLTMVYNTRDYWVFGLFPSYGILKNTTEKNVLETGSFSVLR
jgi:hypothetical protein